MKAIMISIKPKWVAKILNGEKTIEIRKTMPKCDLPITVYIYCTKDNKQGLVWDNQGKGPVNSSLFPYGKDCPERHRLVNGKVVAKFTVRKVEEIKKIFTETYYTYHTKDLEYNELFDKSCLEIFELEEYLNKKIGYAYHIEDLVIFDKPKELIEFKHHLSRNSRNCITCPAHFWTSGFNKNTEPCENDCLLPLTKAPQNFCYVESEE